MALDVIPLIKSSPDPLIRLCITLWAPSLPPPSLPSKNHVTPKIFHPFPPPPATKKTGPLVCYIAFLVEIRVPFTIDGNYTEWTEWSECSASCGGGSHQRTRQCTRPPPKHGGLDCNELGPADQRQQCNPDPCREFPFNSYLYQWLWQLDDESVRWFDLL